VCAEISFMHAKRRCMHLCIVLCKFNVNASVLCKSSECLLENDEVLKAMLLHLHPLKHSPPAFSEIIAR